jgi:hypothetical protein
MDVLIEYEDVVGLIELQRVRWTGHNVRLDKEGA